MTVSWIMFFACAGFLIMWQLIGLYSEEILERREFHRLVPSFKESRSKIQCNVKLHHIPERTKFSILAHYHLKGHKVFSSLPI